HEQQRRLAILDDESDLRAGEPPVHRRHHHAGLHRAEQQFEIDVAVLAEIGDALAVSDAGRLQRVGDAVGIAIELREGGPASLEFKDDGIAAALRLHADGFGKVVRLLGHVVPMIVVPAKRTKRARAGTHTPCRFNLTEWLSSFATTAVCGYGSPLSR